MGNLLDALKDLEKVTQESTKLVKKTKKMLKDSEDKVKERKHTLKLLSKMK